MSFKLVQKHDLDSQNQHSWTITERMDEAVPQNERSPQTEGRWFSSSL